MIINSNYRKSVSPVGSTKKQIKKIDSPCSTVKKALVAFNFSPKSEESQIKYRTIRKKSIN